MKKEHILIIGGSKGSGSTTAQLMAERGYKVSVISRHEPSKKMAKVQYWQADITLHAEFLKVLQQLILKQGKINHLVFFQQYRGSNNDWAGQVNTSLTGIKNAIESTLDQFVPLKGKNSIVMVSSIAGRFIASEQPVGYHVAKAGLEQMTRYYAIILGPKGIRVNAVAPNIVLKDENREFYFKNKKLYSLYTGISPLRKMVDAKDVANTVAFFCSNNSAGITGQILIVDAGLSLQEHAGMARSLVSLDKIHITQKNFKQKKFIK